MKHEIFYLVQRMESVLRGFVYRVEQDEMGVWVYLEQSSLNLLGENFLLASGLTETKRGYSFRTKAIDVRYTKVFLCRSIFEKMTKTEYSKYEADRQERAKQYNQKVG